MSDQDKQMIETLGEYFSHMTPAILEEMKKESYNLKLQLYRTPKWRKIKRYRLFEKINRVDEDRGLLCSRYE